MGGYYINGQLVDPNQQTIQIGGMTVPLANIPGYTAAANPSAFINAPYSPYNPVGDAYTPGAPGSTSPLTPDQTAANLALTGQNNIPGFGGANGFVAPAPPPPPTPDPSTGAPASSATPVADVNGTPPANYPPAGGDGSSMGATSMIRPPVSGGVPTRPAGSTSSIATDNGGYSTTPDGGVSAGGPSPYTNYGTGMGGGTGADSTGTNGTGTTPVDTSGTVAPDPSASMNQAGGAIGSPGGSASTGPNFSLPAVSNYGQVNPYSVYGYYGAGSGGFSPYSGTNNSSQDWGTAVGSSGQDVSPNASMQQIFAANRNQISNTGNLIGQEAGNALNYYDPLQQQYTNATNTTLNNMASNGFGFTPEQTSQINQNYSQFNTDPSQYAAIAGDPNAPVSTVQSGLGNEGAMLNQYQANLGGEVNQFQANLGGAAGQYGAGVSGALNTGINGVNTGVSTLGTGLQSAQTNFDALDKAVSNPALGFDPNNTESQMSDQDVQNLITSAGTTTGNQFRTAEDTLERQAAQQGNTSPAALAAMRQALVTQEAASAGDTMTQAEIQAKQAQYQRAATIEQQRASAAQTQTGFQATAATTEEAAAQAAAGLYGQAAIGAGEYAGQQALAGAEATGAQYMTAAEQAGQSGIAAANAYGQFSTNQENTMTGQLSTAQSQADQLASQRAAQIAGIQYGQDVGSAQLTSQGAQTVGQQQLASQNTYLSALQQQQAAAQAGGQGALAAQNTAYGTQTGGLGAQSTGQANFTVEQASFGDTAAKALATSLGTVGGTANVGGSPGSPGPPSSTPAPGATPGTSPKGTIKVGDITAPTAPSTYVSQPSPQTTPDQSTSSATPARSIAQSNPNQNASLFAKGGIAFEPTVAKLAEHGPEMVVPLAQYRSGRYQNKFGKVA